ncbi:hypothetical protein ACFL6N_02405 [Thermodesulfobacteriota bacterium]
MEVKPVLSFRVQWLYPEFKTDVHTEKSAVLPELLLLSIPPPASVKQRTDALHLTSRKPYLQREASTLRRNDRYTANRNKGA